MVQGEIERQYTGGGDGGVRPIGDPRAHDTGQAEFIDFVVFNWVERGIGEL